MPGPSFREAATARFGWLRPLGYHTVRDRSGSGSVVFRSGARLIWLIHDWREDTLTVWIAPCWEAAWQDQPGWTFLDIDALLEAEGLPGLMPTLEGLDTSERLARVSAALRGPLLPFVRGELTVVMVAIAEARLPDGVPGRDLPSGSPWQVNDTGDWLLTERRHAETQSVFLAQTYDPDPMVRARAALGLQGGIPLGGASLRDVTARLLELLGDSDVAVRRAAASSLGWRRKRAAFRPMLSLLGDEPGDVLSPVAVALVRMCVVLRPAEMWELRSALDAFAARGTVAARQVAEITRWLDGFEHRRLHRPTEWVLRLDPDGTVTLIE